jgi:hypothetical protein
MKFNEKTTKAVEGYAEAIVNAIKEHQFDFDVDLDYAEAYNEDNTQESRSAMITTSLGVVIVLPDFKKAASAKACILKLGEMRRMEMEGFTEDFIEKNGQIYGTLMPYTVTNAEIFAYYLTHKIDVNAKDKALG